MKFSFTPALAGTLALVLGFAAPALADIKTGAAAISETCPASFLGDPGAKTLKMLVKGINAAGGANGVEIELIVYDCGGGRNKIRTFATRLVQEDEVVAVISLVGAIEIIDPVKPYTFKTPPTDRMASVPTVAARPCASSLEIVGDERIRTAFLGI